MWSLFIEFRVDNDENFKRLQKIFNAFKEEKKNNILDCEDSKWLDYYDEHLLNYFWWPTEIELKEYWELYESIPSEERFNDSRLRKPWDFESMIDAISNGEYELSSCELIKDDIGRVEFLTWSWPYGGAGSLKALIESFGFEIINEEI